MEDKNSQIDRIINEITKDKQLDEHGKKLYTERAMKEAGIYTLQLGSIFLFPLPFISLYLIDFLEFIVISLFLLSELIVLSTFFFFNNPDGLRNF